MYLIFFLSWIIFNGQITTEIFIFGVIIAAAVFWFVCKFMDYSLKKELKLYRSIGFFLWYFLVLLKEIVVANVDVIKRVYTVEETMEPVIVKFKVNLKSDMTRVLLANSITLTPGTITVALEENEYTVHCLDESLAEGLDSSVFVKLLEKYEEE
ncbi:MAG: sodium:proton antiporter [Lachnospiraceae bacterium]|nr:sodium:proton antiporter [Lachnospiraceae bacterium]